MSILTPYIEKEYKHIKEGFDNIKNSFINFFGEEYIDFTLSPILDSPECLETCILSVPIWNIPTIDSEIKYDITLDYSSSTPLRTIIEKCADITYIYNADNLIYKAIKGISNFTNYVTIYYPSITVTNENNNSTVISEVYVRVYFDRYGGIENNAVYMNRAKYTEIELHNNYMHSHVLAIPLNNLSEFQRMCLGTGPILLTMNSLNIDCDICLYDLFCLELDKLIHTESLSGGPYRYLEQLNRCISKIYYHRNRINSLSLFHMRHDYFYSFISYYIQQRSLKFIIDNNRYELGESYYQYLLDISNSYIKYMGDNNFVDDNLENCVLYNDQLYKLDSSTENSSGINGTFLFYFKDVPIYLTIDEVNRSKTVTILNPDIANTLLNIILTIINYKHGRINSNQDSNDNKKIQLI